MRALTASALGVPHLDRGIDTLRPLQHADLPQGEHGGFHPPQVGSIPSVRSIWV